SSSSRLPSRWRRRWSTRSSSSRRPHGGSPVEGSEVGGSGMGRGGHPAHAGSRAGVPLLRRAERWWNRAARPAPCVPVLPLRGRPRDPSDHQGGESRRMNRKHIGLAAAALCSGALALASAAVAGAAPLPEEGIGLPRDASVEGHRVDWLLNVTMVFVTILF